MIDSQLTTEDMMKHLRQFCLGLFLILALSIPALAGDMQCGVTGNMGAGITGEIQTGITGNMPTGVTGEMPTGVAGDVQFPGILLFLMSLL